MNTWEIIGLSFMTVTTALTWGLALGWTLERLVTGRWWWNANKRQDSAQTTYTINTGDADDALARAQRQERHRAAAKLSRF